MFQNPKSTYTLALGWNLLDMREFKNYVRNVSVDLGSRNQVSQYYDKLCRVWMSNCSTLHFPVLRFYCPPRFGGISVWKSCQAYYSPWAQALLPFCTRPLWQWRVPSSGAIWPSWAGYACVSFPLTGSLGICDDPVSNFLFSVLSFGKLSWKWTSFSKKACHVCL